LQVRKDALCTEGQARSGNVVVFRRGGRVWGDTVSDRGTACVVNVGGRRSLQEDDEEFKG